MRCFMLAKLQTHTAQHDSVPQHATPTCSGPDNASGVVRLGALTAAARTANSAPGIGPDHSEAQRAQKKRKNAWRYKGKAKIEQIKILQRPQATFHRIQGL
mmetsp:Transcript_67164/g.119546  ORF Transcript_67164/g.119546 Transcript_67164/m.119546 type:complete len:101 (-) Transcript_67164:28-330(-)